MHKDSETFKILVQNENAYIGLCSCCQEFNFAYKNILLTFSKNELMVFCNWLIECKDDKDYFLPLAHGRNRIYQSPLKNMFLVFSNEELEEISGMLNQLTLLLEARELVLYKE
ncbi:MAG TPA: DUF6686 family protein [Cytophagales bacterium]|nr:DUF6686 family protein [Cytophagales bacterium]